MNENVSKICDTYEWKVSQICVRRVTFIKCFNRSTFVICCASIKVTRHAHICDDSHQHSNSQLHVCHDSFNRTFVANLIHMVFRFALLGYKREEVGLFYIGLVLCIQVSFDISVIHQLVGTKD